MSDEEKIFTGNPHAQVQVYIVHLIAPMYRNLPISNSDKQREYKTTTKS
jgi:hypothetical protein